MSSGPLVPSRALLSQLRDDHALIRGLPPANLGGQGFARDNTTRELRWGVTCKDPSTDTYPTGGNTFFVEFGTLSYTPDDDDGTSTATFEAYDGPLKVVARTEPAQYVSEGTRVQCQLHDGQWWIVIAPTRAWARVQWQRDFGLSAYSQTKKDFMYLAMLENYGTAHEALDGTVSIGGTEGSGRAYRLQLDSPGWYLIHWNLMYTSYRLPVLRQPVLAFDIGSEVDGVFRLTRYALILRGGPSPIGFGYLAGHVQERDAEEVRPIVHLPYGASSSSDQIGWWPIKDFEELNYGGTTLHRYDPEDDPYGLDRFLCARMVGIVHSSPNSAAAWPLLETGQSDRSMKVSLEAIIERIGPTDIAIDASTVSQPYQINGFSNSGIV